MQYQTISRSSILFFFPRNYNASSLIFFLEALFCQRAGKKLRTGITFIFSHFIQSSAMLCQYTDNRYIIDTYT